MRPIFAVGAPKTTFRTFMRDTFFLQVQLPVAMHNNSAVLRNILSPIKCCGSAF
jgi:hypothetical protein